LLSNLLQLLLLMLPLIARSLFEAAAAAGGKTPSAVA
jgi:hypothetical protein